MGKGLSTKIEESEVLRYLQRRGYTDARILKMTPLGQEDQEGLKSYGFGHPIHVEFESQTEIRSIVIRTMAPDPFGHSRRADRVANMVLGFDTFDAIPGHIHPLDVGTFGQSGAMLSFGPGEPFLVTNYVDGELYARDLNLLTQKAKADDLDLQRAEALALYLANLHSEKRNGTAYRRALRDLVGSGEGIFGLCDSYPHDDAIATPERLRHIERLAVNWRWKLMDSPERCRRTHGDFHPFNILFREGKEFSVLDCSRGAAGDPADDITGLAVNFLFFGLRADIEFKGAHRELWDHFFQTYLGATGDSQINQVVAPFFAWRILVVVSPLWYPDVPAEIREKLLRFVERLLNGDEFDYQKIDELLS